MRIRDFLIGLLVPKFLVRFDRFLLLNHPQFWFARIHYVAFYALLANGLVVVLMYTLPIQIHHIETIDIFFNIAQVIIGVCAIWWFVSRFYLSAIERDISSSGLERLKSALYMFCLGVLVFPLCLLELSTADVMSGLIGTEEVEQDCTRLSRFSSMDLSIPDTIRTQEEILSIYLSRLYSRPSTPSILDTLEAQIDTLESQVEVEMFLLIEKYQGTKPDSSDANAIHSIGSKADSNCQRLRESVARPYGRQWVYILFFLMLNLYIFFYLSELNFPGGIFDFFLCFFVLLLPLSSTSSGSTILEDIIAGNQIALLDGSIKLSTLGFLMLGIILFSLYQVSQIQHLERHSDLKEVSLHTLSLALSTTLSFVVIYLGFDSQYFVLLLFLAPASFILVTPYFHRCFTRLYALPE